MHRPRVVTRGILLTSVILVILWLCLIIFLLFFVVSRMDGTASLSLQSTDGDWGFGSGDFSRCAIVFGAGVHSVKDREGREVGGVAGPGILRRVKTATDLYHRGQIQTLFLTGGKGSGRKASEAEVMRDVAVREGVKVEDIVLEPQARSTKENLLNTLPLTVGKCDSLVGISDGYHLARIEFLARQLGWRLPTIRSKWRPERLFEVRSILREVAAILWYSIFA